MSPLPYRAFVLRGQVVLGSTWIPTVCNMMAFWAPCGGFGLSFMCSGRPKYVKQLPLGSALHIGLGDKRDHVGMWRLGQWDYCFKLYSGAQAALGRVFGNIWVCLDLQSKPYLQNLGPVGQLFLVLWGSRWGTKGTQRPKGSKYLTSKNSRTKFH